jgi:hypothetical protein
MPNPNTGTESGKRSTLVALRAYLATVQRLTPCVPILRAVVLAGDCRRRLLA